MSEREGLRAECPERLPCVDAPCPTHQVMVRFPWDGVYARMDSNMEGGSREGGRAAGACALHQQPDPSNGAGCNMIRASTVATIILVP
eukprot:scaffold322957_cov18-Tisochrysis_lutea.AAC.1